MKIKTGILAISMILLVSSLSITPVFAQPTLTPLTASKSNDLTLTDNDVKTLDNFYVSFLNDLVKVKDLNGFHKLVDSYLLKWGNHPLLRFLHRLVVRATIERHLIHFRSLRTTAFVMSMGSMPRLLSRQNFHSNFYRPYTIWLYGNQNNNFMKSRTFILDFHPFSILNVDGRQIGFMLNFYGFYIRSYRPLVGNEHTFFFGHAQRIRVLDLSPFD